MTASFSKTKDQAHTSEVSEDNVSISTEEVVVRDRHNRQKGHEEIEDGLNKIFEPSGCEVLRQIIPCRSYLCF